MEKKGYEGTCWKTRRRNSYNKLIVEIQHIIQEVNNTEFKRIKNEEAMEYLMAEFDKMEINLDRMLFAQ